MSSFRKASRIDAIGVSEILQIGARADSLKKEGKPVIVLGAGEPDFDTPDQIKQAAIEQIWQGQTKYTALTGTPELKRAISDKYQRQHGLEFAEEEIIVSSGAKQVIYNAFMASLEPGDEVIVPAPFWTSYVDIIALAGGRPVLVPCGADTGYRMTAPQLEAALSSRTRWVLFNSPSNPSGAAYSAWDYAPLLKVLLRHPDVWIMADDMYEHIVYDDFEFTTPMAVEPGLQTRCLTINGVSKAYAMTGWRIGYGVGPKELIAAMAVIQGQSTSCASSVSQAAAAAALNGPQDFLELRRNSFQSRRDVVVDGLNAIEGIHCPRPEGAFYTFANCAGLLGRQCSDGRMIQTDRDFCRYLLESHNVAVVPGSAFGLSPYFRISYATAEAELREALGRIENAVALLR